MNLLVAVAAWAGLALGLAAMLLIALVVRGRRAPLDEQRQAENARTAQIEDLQRQLAALQQELQTLSTAQETNGLKLERVAAAQSEITTEQRAVRKQPSAAQPVPPPDPEAFPARPGPVLARAKDAVIVSYQDLTKSFIASSSGPLTVLSIKGRPVMIPSGGFLESSSDFAALYEQAFTCSKPRRGDLVVKAPALVRQQPDRSYQLIEKGELGVDD